MVSLAKLYDEGGRPALRAYAEELKKDWTPAERLELDAFTQGWFAAREVYDPR